MLPHILRALLILTMCSNAWASMHPVACESAPANTTGQITQLNWNGAAILSGITWNALGQPLGWKWAFTDSTILPSKTATFSASRSYNTAGQQTANEVASYTYDADGHISSLTQKLRTPATTKATDTTTTEQTARWTVTYDPAGRITGFTPSAPAVTATSTLNPQSTTYGYDGNGNRLSSNQTQPTPSATSPTASTTTSRDYQYSEGNNRLTNFTQTLANAQGQTSTQNTYSLDTQGQLLSDGLRNYGYDAQGRLSDITTTTNTGSTTTRYAHNALGQRIFKTEPQYSTAKAAEEGTDTNQGTNQDLGLIDTLVNFFTNLWNPIARPAEKQGFAYLYDEEGTLLAEYGSGGVASAGNAKYIYLPTATGPQPVLTIQNDKPYAVHADHLNTPRRLTQADGQVAWQWAYSAFGDEAPTTAANRFTSPSTNPTTGTTPIKQVVFNLRYPGQYADAESNLFYNYFRSYDAKTGRYTQADPIGLNGGWNRSVYANGNPLGYVDPEGLHESSPWLRALVPGQVAYDRGLTAIENGNYGAAAVSFGTMFGEQLVTVLSLGISQSSRVATVPVVNAIESCAAKGVTGVPGRVGSRINLSNEGMEHVIARHLSGKANASQFSLTEAELRALLSSRAAVNSPVLRTVDSANGVRYVREFDAGRVIGSDRFNGNQATSIMTIMSDRFGNLVTTFPGILK
jgi:RHS repeat-associated protein